MSTLKNARHERFAQELAAGKAATDAYAEAGLKPNRGNATALKQKQSIVMRVAEILDQREAIHNAADAMTGLAASEMREVRPR